MTLYTPFPEFKYKDRVKVISGFYEGLMGTANEESSDSNRLGILLEFDENKTLLIFINKDCLEKII